MRASFWRAAVGIVGMLASVAAGQDLYKGVAVPFKVRQSDTEWRGEAPKGGGAVRGGGPKEVKEPGAGRTPGVRTVEPRPLIVFSHGMGGSRAGYAYICEHLASQGYVVVAPTHEGSDTEAIRKEMRDRIKKRLSGEQESAKGLIVENTGDPDNLRSRPKDITSVIDHVAHDPELSKLVDLDRIGVAGHSFGAYTAMAEGGMLVDLPEGKDQNLRDPRVKAVLPMSPEGHGVMGIDAGAWNKFAVPVLFLTGTKDYGQGQRSAAWRREAFDAIKTVDEYLVVLDGATHMTFGGRGSGSEHWHHEEVIKAVATAWFDAQLKGDEQAATWLKEFAGTKRTDCTAEHKAGERK